VHRQRARRLLAGQRQADAANPPQLPEVHQGAGGAGHGQAVLVRLPRRLGLVARGHPLRDRGGHHQDEHRHRHAVGLLGWHPLVRVRIPPLPAGPDWQPRRRGEAEQEVLRPAHGAPPRRGVHGQAAVRGGRGPQLHQRCLDEDRVLARHTQGAADASPGCGPQHTAQGEACFTRVDPSTPGSGWYSTRTHARTHPDADAQEEALLHPVRRPCAWWIGWPPHASRVSM